MLKRWIAAATMFLVAASSAGCEITASAFVQQEYSINPRLDKPDGLARAEIKIARLVGRDARK